MITTPLREFLLFLLSLLHRAQPALLSLLQSVLRRFTGLARNLWDGLLVRIAELDRNSTLTNEQRHELATEWLHDQLEDTHGLTLPGNPPDWERRIVQGAVLYLRLKAWLQPAAA